MTLKKSTPSDLEFTKRYVELVKQGYTAEDARKLAEIKDIGEPEIKKGKKKTGYLGIDQEQHDY